jgi:hypothetical protein
MTKVRLAAVLALFLLPTGCMDAPADEPADASPPALDGEPAEPIPRCGPLELAAEPQAWPLIQGAGVARVGAGDPGAPDGGGSFEGDFVFRGARVVETAVPIRCPGFGTGCVAESTLAFDDAAGARVELDLGLPLAELPTIADGTAVHVVFGEHFVVTRVSDGGLLLALTQTTRNDESSFDGDDVVALGAQLALAPAVGCKQVSDDTCHHAFELYSLEVKDAAGVVRATVPPTATGEVTTDAGQFRVTNKMVLRRVGSGSGQPECADFWPTHFIAEVVRIGDAP